ncbi:MAG: IclR family transcriptional regulator [Puniceicoccales bacterium]
MDTVQSLHRAVKVLYFIAGREGGSTVAEVASGVGLKSITTYKIIRTLEAENLLKRLGPPLRFTLGQSIHELKHLDDDRTLLTIASKFILQAQREQPETHFALLQYDHGDTYERLLVEPKHFGRIIRQRQHRLHSYNSASSLLFLAFSSDKEKAQFMNRHPFEDEGRRYWTSLEKLELFLKTIRRREWSEPLIAQKEYHGIAAPIWSADRRVIAAMGAYTRIGEASLRTQQTMRKICRQSAQSITQELQLQLRNHF